MRILKITVAALIVLAFVALAGVGRPEAAGGAGDDTRDGITVTGTGEVRATPDRATLTFSVQSDATTAKGALEASSAAARRVIGGLEEAGVAPKDLKTEHLDVSPRYDVDKVDRPRGYSASSSLTVSNQPLERATRLVDVGVAAGADSVSGPSLSVEDRDAEYRRALERAFRDARAKAETLAAAASVSVGAVMSIVEGGQSGGPVWTEARGALADTKTPIEPGSEQVMAAVTVTFALR
jgi:uncharacterized protein